MTIQEMKQRKAELGYTNKDIARMSGVPFSTVAKLFCGAVSSPRRATILALESVLSSTSREYPSDTSHRYGNNDTGCPALQDPGTPYQNGSTASSEYRKQGEYTLEDYLALPDDQRVELIDGVFYDMAAPYVVHQLIATQIGYQLLGFVEKHKGSCKPVLSPVDVQLDRDDKTVVQPDVMVLCNPELLIRSGRVFGAPDFVIEILSRSTRKKDMFLKLMKYSEAGVREYWIIDPDKLFIAVYDLENNEFPVYYSFADTVPVRIWEKKCSVDFRAVYEYIKDYLEEL